MTHLHSSTTVGDLVSASKCWRGPVPAGLQQQLRAGLLVRLRDERGRGLNLGLLAEGPVVAETVEVADEGRFALVRRPR